MKFEDRKDKWIYFQAGMAMRCYAAVDCLERFFDSRGLKRAIWAVLIFAVIYFSPIIFNIFNR